jgi:site-specific DNA-cytosine methylase
MQDLSDDAVLSLIRKYGDFDLVVGGNACNNLLGSGEYDPKQFSLFLEYVRILKAVRSAKGSGR